jgi:hypothetical protein
MINSPSLWSVSPIKGKYNTILGYLVVTGVGKARTVAHEFTLGTEPNAVELAYENATLLAKFLNIAEEAK